MNPFPPLKCALYVCIDDDAGHRSRLEAVTDGGIVVATPADVAHLDSVHVGSHLVLFWINADGRVVLPVRLTGILPGPPERWEVQPLGEARRLGRRRHERGGGGEPMRLSTFATQPAVTFDSTLLDLSEKALRCWTPAFDIAVGERVHVRALLSIGTLSQIGTVTAVREAPNGLGQHLVVVFQSPSASTVQLIRRYLFVWGPVYRRARRGAEENE
ncbi:hypothetical protein GCM10010156_61330 [Planobispora rosea]|uniref:PilZ domain-containing protein n=1 Tax=Planobispora rosea TaxID=35762 RepID=A0A8J3S602_PLARO|nr:PilZ domain-containing protein [Planobispora rosea]GGS94806.1 hypothetical protein GCM10010156_61330 [Planobispora rosea]GIH87434.1 hypothetical protein Pro02_58420 [Planobispora rosea]